MTSKPRYTFHYTPVEYFDALDPGEDYLPPAFEQEGFIHCTDGAQNLATVGDYIYKEDPRDFWVLYIDKARVRSPIKYDDPDQIYPHIYGPLNRDAIVDKRRAVRGPDGTFLPVEELE